MNYELKPNFKIAGKIFGSRIKLFQEALKTLTKEDIKKLENNETINIKIEDNIEEVTSEMVDIRINSKEGFNATLFNNNFIILNTTLTDALIHEGIARELVSKVQNLRKSKDFDIVDRIKLYYSHNDKFAEIVKEYEEFIKKETLAVELIEKSLDTNLVNLNGLDIYIDVEKV